MNTVLLADFANHAIHEATTHWWSGALRGAPTPAPRRTRGQAAPQGDAGGQRLAARLDAILDDNWTLICGHRNSGGRLGHILVGPRGVMTLACTAVHGRVHCDGVRWRRDKFDLYNNLVERDAPVPGDLAGTLYQASACLRHVLLEHTSIRQVALALVFTHHAATLGTIRHGQLTMVSLLPELKTATLLQAMSGHPDHRTIDGVVEVIRHEHERGMRQAEKKGRSARPCP